MRKIALIAVLGLLLSSGLSVIAGNSARWPDVSSQFNDKRNSPRADIRAKVATELAEGLYPAVEFDTARMLVAHIKNEVDRAKKDVASEIQVAYPVLEASVDVLRKISQPKAVEYLLKNAQDEKTAWRVRFHVIQALAAVNKPEVITALVKLVDDPNVPVKIAAFNALAELKAPDAANRACQLLNEDVTWEVKIAAVKYIEMIISAELFEPLVNVLQDYSLEGCVRLELVNLLKQATGQDLGILGKPWLDWWNKKKAGENPAPQPASNETISIIPTLYYGITVTSTRMIFIVDISDSMAQKAKYDEDHYSKRDESESHLKRVLTDASPLAKAQTQSQKPEEKPANPEQVNRVKALKKELDARPVVNRLDAARKELVNAIYHLDPGVEFSIIFFDAQQRVWKDTLVPANLENKIAALDYINQKFGMGGGTGFYDAIELAYKFIGKDKKTEVKSGYADANKPKEKIVQLVRNCFYINSFGGADTFFMVTDGAPTYGRITNKGTIISEIKKISRIRGVKINTVGIGDPPLDPNNINQRMDVDARFLAELAVCTGGVFKDKTSKHPSSSEPDKK